MIHKEFECELYLIRHGQSESNASPPDRHSLNYDSNLTPKGEEQARRLGARIAAEGLTFDRIYCSTYKRAIMTARIMVEEMGAPETEIPQVHALREQRAPDKWRGKRFAEIVTPEVRAYMAAKGSDYKPEGGESVREVERRISGWVEEELVYNPGLASRPVSMRVALVGHGTAHTCLIRYILGFDQRMIWRFGLDNCSISRFRFDCKGWRLISINDAAHIAGMDGVTGEEMPASRSGGPRGPRVRLADRVL